MSKHLHLEYKFTDRGGREVYEIFNGEDDKRMMTPLGTARFYPRDESGYAPVSVDWLVEKTEDELEEDDCAPDPAQLELDV